MTHVESSDTCSGTPSVRWGHMTGSAAVPRPKQPTPEGFPQRLQELMAAAKINAAELSARTRPTPEAKPLLERSTITSYLNGRREPTGQKLVVLAQALGVSPDALLAVTSPALKDSAQVGALDQASRNVPIAVREALDAHPWPPGTPTATVAAISDALAKEAFAHRNSYIPPSHWTRRIDEELAAAKGKRMAPPVVEDDDADGPSPEMRAHKVSKTRRSR